MQAITLKIADKLVIGFIHLRREPLVIIFAPRGYPLNISIHDVNLFHMLVPEILTGGVWSGDGHNFPWYGCWLFQKCLRHQGAVDLSFDHAVNIISQSAEMPH